jgi:hypothetical protein
MYNDPRNKLAWRIYEALNAKGARLGDAATVFIDRELRRALPKGLPTKPAVLKRRITLLQKKYQVELDGVSRLFDKMEAKGDRGAANEYGRAKFYLTDFIRDLEEIKEAISAKAAARHEKGTSG